MPQDVTPSVTAEVIPANIFDSTWSPQEDAGRESAQQVLFAVFKHKWLIFSLCLVFTIAAGIAMYLKPLIHTATARILLKGDRLSLQIADLSSLLTNRVPFSLQLLQSEIEVVRSRGVLFPAAEKLLTRKLGKPEDEITKEQIENEMSNLQGRLSVVAVPDTNVIEVGYSAPTVVEAVQTLNEIVEQYQEQHTVAHSGSTELVKFYEQEKARTEAALHEAEEGLKKWQAANNVVSIDPQIQSSLQLKVEQEAGLQRAEAEMLKVREQDQFLAKLKGELITANVALQALLQHYTDEDRRVQEQKEQVALLKQELATAEQALQSSLEAEREAFRKQITNTVATLADLREKKTEYTRLARLVDLNSENFLLYGKKLEEARTAAGMDRDRLANIVTLEPPYAPPSTDLYKRIAIVFIAAIMGLILGTIIALTLGFFNSSFRMEEDIERYLKLPVLAVIPDLRRSVSP